MHLESSLQALLRTDPEAYKVAVRRIHPEWFAEDLPEHITFYRNAVATGFSTPLFGDIRIHLIHTKPNIWEAMLGTYMSDGEITDEAFRQSFNQLAPYLTETKRNHFSPEEAVSALLDWIGWGGVKLPKLKFSVLPLRDLMMEDLKSCMNAPVRPARHYGSGTVYAELLSSIDHHLQDIEPGLPLGVESV